MKKRLVLPVQTIEILKQYGEISDVINKILSIVETNQLSVNHIVCDSINQYKTRKITVDICSTILFDKHIHLGKIIQYFVENELFNEFDFTYATIDNDAELVHLNKALVNLLDASMASNNHMLAIRHIYDDVRYLIQEIKDEYTMENQQNV